MRADTRRFLALDGSSTLRFRRRICGALLLAILAFASAAGARDRIDLVRMTNGDRLTCEIISLRSAALSVRTAMVGTVTVDWPDVASLISVQSFELELVDGRRVIGRLDETEKGGEVAIHLENGESLVVPLADVVGIVQLGSTLFQGRRGYLDLGWDYSSAEEVTQLSLGARLDLQGPRVRWSTELSATLSDDADSPQRLRSLLQTSLEVPVRLKWVVVGVAGYETNDDLDLDSRVTGSVQAIYYPRRSSRGRWGIGAGLAGTEENYFGEEESTTSTLAALLVTGDYDRFGRFGTNASGQLAWMPVLDGSGRYRIELRGSLRQKIFSDFTISLSPYLSYDSMPPQSEAKSQDWGWVSSVGWNF